MIQSLIIYLIFLNMLEHVLLHLQILLAVLEMCGLV